MALGLVLVFTLQSVFHPFKETKLSGAEPDIDVDSFSFHQFESGVWQNQITNYTEKKFGFRAIAVRVFNQFNHSLFGETGRFVIEGRDGYLFEKSYRPSVCGENFVGELSLSSKVDSIQILAEKLSKLNKELVLLLAPNKWRVMRDKIEWNCDSSETNYDVFKTLMADHSLVMLDANQLLGEFKSEHPLYSKNGTHWSIFGSAMVAQEIQKLLVERGVSEGVLRVESLEISDEPKNTDRDLHDLQNLMERPTDLDLAYPSLKLDAKNKPRALVIGDSYFRSFYYTNAFPEMFSLESYFLYYNKTLFRQDLEAGEAISVLEFRTQLKMVDVIIIETNEDALPLVGWGFLSDAIQVLNE
jgi:hypothetical protein